MAYVFIAIATVIGYLDYLGLGNLLAAGALLKHETFASGSNITPFYKWLGALIIVGLIGYNQTLRPFATAFLVLILLSLVLSRQNAVTSVITAL